MKTETYKMSAMADGRSVEHDGNAEGEYATKIAAFESAVPAASNARPQNARATYSAPPASGAFVIYPRRYLAPARACPGDTSRAALRPGPQP